MAKDPLWEAFPHCDPSVLHAPGICEYCDEHPDWQTLRDTWGIAYTGQTPADDQVPCPADARRGTGMAHEWRGNRPLPPSQALLLPCDPQPITLRQTVSGWFGGH